MDPTNISSEELKEFLEELKRKPGTPNQCLQDDSAAIQGLIDLLVVKKVIPGEHPNELVISYMDRYNSAVTGLIMLLVEKNVITEAEMDASMLAFHHAVRHFGDRATSFEEVSKLRRDTLKKQLNR
jgi:hypothetical protein